MNIKLNKDFETEYPDDVWRGFTIRQVISIFLAGAFAIGTGALIWYLTRINPTYCVYLGMPVMAIILYIGFKQNQDMYLEEYIRELSYERKIRHLSFDAGEFNEHTARRFSMDAGVAERKLNKKRKGA